MSSELTIADTEEAFRASQEYGFERFSFEFRGAEGVASVKSNWNYFSPASKGLTRDALLVKEGDITILNPNPNDPVQIINIQLDEHVHHFAGEERLQDNCLSSVILYPRSKDKLSLEGQGEFRDQIDASIPNAAYTKHRSESSYPTRGLRTPHGEALIEDFDRQLKGLPILKVAHRRVEDSHLEILENLRGADKLISDSDFREGLCNFIEEALIRGNLQAIGHNSVISEPPTLPSGGAANPDGKQQNSQEITK